MVVQTRRRHPRIRVLVMSNVHEDKAERVVRRRHPRIRVLVMSNVHEDKAEREGVYDIVGADKGWGR